MRLFVSVDLPPGLAEPIRELQSSLGDASGLRFTDPTQAHVTLKFLGETAPDRVPELERAIEDAVATADLEPFTVEFGGLGVFPDLEYISVVWVGTRRGGDRLARLHEALEAETTALGFEPEDHDFTPHVTIARMDHAGGKSLVQEAVRSRDPDVGSMTVEEVRLTESRLRSDGPVYETVHAVSLE